MGITYTVKPASSSMPTYDPRTFNKGALRGANKWQYPKITPGQQPSNINLSNSKARPKKFKPLKPSDYNKGALSSANKWKYPDITPYSREYADEMSGKIKKKRPSRDPDDLYAFATQMANMLPNDPFWKKAVANLTRFRILKTTGRLTPRDEAEIERINTAIRKKAQDPITAVPTGIIPSGAPLPIAAGVPITVDDASRPSRMPSFDAPLDVKHVDADDVDDDDDDGDDDDR